MTPDSWRGRFAPRRDHPWYVQAMDVVIMLVVLADIRWGKR